MFGFEITPKIKGCEINVLQIQGFKTFKMFEFEITPKIKGFEINVLQIY